MKKNKSPQVSKKAIGPFDDKPIALPEGIDMEDHVIATYWIQVDKAWDMSVLGQILAIEQTTGTWVPVPGETPEIRAGHVAKVIGVYEAPSYEYALPPEVTTRQYILQIAFPAANVEDQLPMMLTAVIGNISMVPNFKLLDLRIPKVTLEQYKGPQFGTDGWWKALGIKKGRPLLNNMIKPCSGYPLEVGTIHGSTFDPECRCASHAQSGGNLLHLLQLRLLDTIGDGNRFTVQRSPEDVMECLLPVRL